MNAIIIKEEYELYQHAIVKKIHNLLNEGIDIYDIDLIIDYKERQEIEIEMSQYFDTMKKVIFKLIY